MSQEKVDRRKAEKANRKEIMRKKKLKLICLKIGSVIVAAAIIAWLGYSLYSRHQAELPREEYSVNIDSLMNYTYAIGTEEEAADESTSAESDGDSSAEADGAASAETDGGLSETENAGEE